MYHYPALLLLCKDIVNKSRTRKREWLKRANWHFQVRSLLQNSSDFRVSKVFSRRVNLYLSARSPLIFRLNQNETGE